MGKLFSAPCLVASLLAVAALGCGDDAVTPVPKDDDVGEDESDSSGETDTTESDSTGTESETDTSESDSTESESTESETDTTEPETDTSESETGSETGSEPESCALPVVDIAFSLVGAASPVDSCEDYSFAGQHFGGNLGGTYNLDGCPCGASCVLPDPYTLTLDLPDPAMLPVLDACPTVHLRRDPDSCEPTSVTVETQQGEVLFVASREPFAAVDFPALAVTPVNATDCEGFTQHALEVMHGDAIELVSQGEEATLPSENGQWVVQNYAAQDSAGEGNYDWAALLD